MGHIFVDRSYPNCFLLEKSIQNSMNESESMFKKLQYARIKDISRCLGVLQARLYTLCPKMIRWDKSEVLRISEICVLIQKLMIRMSRPVSFDDNVGLDSDVTYLISEINNEKRRVIDERAGKECVSSELATNSVNYNLEEYIGRVMINDEFITNPVIDRSLLEDPIICSISQRLMGTIRLRLSGV